MQSRWRSKFAWGSLVALILFVLKTYFHYDIPEADKLADMVLLTLTGFGLFNNPENKEGF